MRIIECPQLSPEWFEARRGLPTCSNFGRIITEKTHRLAAAAQDYIDELIAEVHHIGPLSDLTTPPSRAMQRGTECEPEARRFYELRGLEVRQVGLCVTDDGRFGGSPDGLVGESGCIEIKCPMGKTHVGYLRYGVLPSEYRAQTHGHLIVTGRDWCDFMSYCPGLPEFLCRVTPDDYTAKLRGVLDEFHERYLAAREAIASM